MNQKENCVQILQPSRKGFEIQSKSIIARVHNSIKIVIIANSRYKVRTALDCRRHRTINTN
jgi:hypothetical protein